jgi:hypothetical protein
MSQKIVLDEKQILQVETLAPYLTIQGVADHLGISARSFFCIKERQPEVLAAYKRGASKAIIFAAQALFSFMQEKTNSALKLDALKFYLIRKAGWTDVREIIQPNIAEEIETPQEKEERIKEINLFLKWKEEQQKKA